MDAQASHISGLPVRSVEEAEAALTRTTSRGARGYIRRYLAACSLLDTLPAQIAALVGDDTAKARGQRHRDEKETE